MLVALYFTYRPIIFGGTDFLTDINTGLVLMGLGLGLDSLKDYSKLNWLDKKVLHKPKRAKVYFIVLGILILTLIVNGMIGYFSSKESMGKDFSIGLIVFGIGCIGFLRSGILATKDYMHSVNTTSSEEE